MRRNELTDAEREAIVANRLDQCIIKPGLKAAMNGYLADFEPAETYNAETDMLVSSEQIVYELESVYDAEINEIANYMASAGYRYHFVHADSISGWILRKR